MSKYNTLWAYIHENGESQLTLTFDEIGQIAGAPLDHSFLKYKNIANAVLNVLDVLFLSKRKKQHL